MQNNYGENKFKSVKIKRLDTKDQWGSNGVYGKCGLFGQHKNSNVINKCKHGVLFYNKYTIIHQSMTMEY